MEMRKPYAALLMCPVRLSALSVILEHIIVEMFTVLGQLGHQVAQATVVPFRLASVAMEATLQLRQPRRGLNRRRIITAVMRWSAAECGLRQIHGHMPSSEVGAGLLITGRLDQVNSLQAVLPVESVIVIMEIRLVMAVPGHTPQAAAIRIAVII